eukprot:TRINITY_DN10614_c0_g1_i1.p2 TRINITY_DN10614_c0_g1~~TRINITY_DN10614_c0_g1_i1.p2  ORF type:complete len:202 (-),score=49.83 TRINITY_DN10614_c0_g1_i1:269-874(-)
MYLTCKQNSLRQSWFSNYMMNGFSTVRFFPGSNYYALTKTDYDRRSVFTVDFISKVFRERQDNYIAEEEESDEKDEADNEDDEDVKERNLDSGNENTEEHVEGKTDEEVLRSDDIEVSDGEVYRSNDGEENLVENETDHVSQDDEISLADAATNESEDEDEDHSDPDIKPDLKIIFFTVVQRFSDKKLKTDHHIQDAEDRS